MHKVYNKPVLDKLGVKSDARVSVVGVKDEGFWKQLTHRTTEAVQGRVQNGSGLIFFAADNSRKELSQLRKLKSYLRSDGGIWVVSKKGKEATIKDVDVIAASKSVGLVDNKVVGFSEKHTAWRLVISVVKRTH